MSAPKTPEECIVIVDPCEMSGDDSLCWDAVDSFATCSRITAYAAEKVREATEALSKENADLRAMLAKASQEEWLKHRAAMARDAEVHSIRTERDAARESNADLRARLKAIRKSFGWNRGTFEGDFETLLDRALDLTRPFKEGV